MCDCQGMPNRWVAAASAALALALASGKLPNLAAQQSKGSACLAMRLVFDRRGYLLREPIAGMVVVTNASNRPVDVMDLCAANNAHGRRGNLAIQVRDKKAGTQLRIRPTGIVFGGGGWPPTYKLKPGESFCSEFLLDKWLSVRSPGTFEVYGELTVYCGLEKATVHGRGTFSCRTGTAEELDAVVDRLELMLRVPPKEPDGCVRPTGSPGVEGPGPPPIPGFLVERISYIDSPRASAVLSRLALGSGSAIRKSAAIRGLARQSSSVAVKTLSELVSDANEDEHERHAAAWSLSVSNAKGAARALASAYRSTSAAVRRVVVSRLCEVKASWATDVLRKMESDEDADIRNRVRDELARRENEKQR